MLALGFHIAPRLGLERKIRCMREDMSKVVIERPRSGHSLPSAKTGLRLRQYDESDEFDELPRRVSGTRNKHLRPRNTKHFSDLLGPLRRYLRSNVGRPWDKVYSEMKQHLDNRKTTGRHIFEHVEREVVLDCFETEDRKVYERSRFGGRVFPVTGFYVHPRTRLLCWKDPGKSERYHPPPSVLTHLGDGWYRVKLDGIWFVVQLEFVGEQKTTPGGKLLNEERVTKETWQQGKRLWRFINKRQYNHKELKAAGLTNDAAA